MTKYGKTHTFNILWDIVATISIVTLAIVYQMHYKLHKEELFTQQRILNNTIASDHTYLIFNRVPKAGSEMLWTLINSLANENNFTSYSDSAKAKANRGSENAYLPTREGRKYYVDMWRPKPNKSLTFEPSLTMESGTEIKTDNKIT